MPSTNEFERAIIKNGKQRIEEAEKNGGEKLNFQSLGLTTKDFIE